MFGKILHIVSQVFLTFIGGGVFQNSRIDIYDAIGRALAMYPDFNLEVIEHANLEFITLLFNLNII